MRPIPEDTLLAIQRHFHDVNRGRACDLIRIDVAGKGRCFSLGGVEHETNGFHDGGLTGSTGTDNTGELVVEFPPLSLLSTRKLASLHVPACRKWRHIKHSQQGRNRLTRRLPYETRKNP